MSNGKFYIHSSFIQLYYYSLQGQQKIIFYSLDYWIKTVGSYSIRAFNYLHISLPSNKDHSLSKIYSRKNLRVFIDFSSQKCFFLLIPIDCTNEFHVDLFSSLSKKARKYWLMKKIRFAEFDLID